MLPPTCTYMPNATALVKPLAPLNNASYFTSNIVNNKTQGRPSSKGNDAFTPASDIPPISPKKKFLENFSEFYLLQNFF